MTRKDGLLALLVVVVWGLNFVVIKLGLHNMPPLMLVALRFFFATFPVISVAKTNFFIGNFFDAVIADGDFTP